MNQRSAGNSPCPWLSTCRLAPSTIPSILHYVLFTLFALQNSTLFLFSLTRYQRTHLWESLLRKPAQEDLTFKASLRHRARFCLIKTKPKDKIKQPTGIINREKEQVWLLFLGIHHKLEQSKYFGIRLIHRGEPSKGTGHGRMLLKERLESLQWFLLRRPYLVQFDGLRRKAGRVPGSSELRDWSHWWPDPDFYVHFLNF